MQNNDDHLKAMLKMHGEEQQGSTSFIQFGRQFHGANIDVVGLDKCSDKIKIQ